MNLAVNKLIEYGYGISPIKDRHGDDLIARLHT
jgi:hypothetical protein